MTEFEYHVEKCEVTSISEKRLAKLGHEGWELTAKDQRELFYRGEPQGRRKIVHYSPVPVRFYYFKRAVLPGNPSRPQQSMSPNLMWGIGQPYEENQ